MDDVARLTQSPFTLMTQAAGSPAEMGQKLQRLAKALRQYAHPVVIDERLARLERLGYVDAIPSRVQLAIGAYDMLRFFIAPAAADYYDSKGINFNFHQLLRFLLEGHEAVLVEDHLHALFPELPRVNRHVLEDALTEFTGPRRRIQTWQLLLELHAKHRPPTRTLCVSHGSIVAPAFPKKGSRCLSRASARVSRS